jgi:SanA protein
MTIFKNKYFFKIFLIVLGVALVMGLFIFQINKNVQMVAEGKVFTNTVDIPKNMVGLLLGTSKKTLGGQVNFFYEARLEATKELYKSGKIDKVLISGDNSTKYYSEPQDMKEDLIKRGIPENKIFLDYAGFRTLDSIIRAEKIFGLQKYTIITQKFHCERALYIAERQQHQAVCFSAKGMPGISGYRVIAREKLARVKAWIDLNILHKQPKFLGEKIQIL